MELVFETLGNALNVISAFSLVFSVLAWLAARRTEKSLARERARLQERIEILLVLEQDGRQRELPVSLRRAELTRAELLGRLGMMPMRTPGARFALRYLSTPGFLAQLEAAQAASGAYRFVIPCSDAGEYEQFAD